MDLKCDRAADGLLTCDPTRSFSRTWYGPWASCLDGPFGNTLAWLNGTMLKDCTGIDGLYLS